MKTTETYLRRLNHKYAHNRRYFELKCRLWNAFRGRLSEEKTILILDNLDEYPDQVKEAISSMDIPGAGQKELCQYIDWIVELGGIVE